jgi:predicted amidohydrolase
MATMRVALANVPFPATSEQSVMLAVDAIDQARAAGAGIICFPECFVPGYRGLGRHVAPPDADFLDRAWTTIAVAAGRARVAAVLGTERIVKEQVRISVLVISPEGSILGFQDKVQLDPSEDTFYTAGEGRQVFTTGPLTFGVAICHEGWRYPETVRWAARRGAQLVFHPHFHPAGPDNYRPTSFADPANTFHEKAALCRAAENTCFFATTNYATAGRATTSAIVRPDGTVLAWHPYDSDGLLVADIDLAEATGLLASRCKEY